MAVESKPLDERRDDDDDECNGNRTTSLVSNLCGVVEDRLSGHQFPRSPQLWNESVEVMHPLSGRTRRIELLDWQYLR